MSPRRPLVESLENRTLLANVTFAVIGDFGVAGQPAADVANRVKSWDPAFVATVGDNNYPSGEASTIDRNIGQYYHDFIAPYKGSYGAGSPNGVNRFFPALGNHDWVVANAAAHLNYFTLPGNERYYTMRNGPVELFVLDSDPREPDLGYTGAAANTQNSQMGQWLKNALAASSAPWKLVVMHHAPYSSSASHGNSAWMQYPYQQWGAHAVLTGHDHNYERIVKNGLPYFVNGAGGAPLRTGFKATPESGSAVRYAADYGAMKVDASDTGITFRFITRAGQTIDTYTLTKGATPPPPPPPPSGSLAAPTSLTAVASSSTVIDLRWADNATSETGYKIERSTDGRTFYPLAGGGANMTFHRNTGLTAGRRYYYRVFAVNGGAKSAFSNVASAAPGGTTQPPPPQPPPPSAGAPAAPSGLVVSPSGSVANALNLSWQDNAANESGYKIERSTDGKTFYVVGGGGTNTTFYRDTNLTAGRRYYYRVFALNAAGKSAYSNVVSAVATSSASSAASPAPTATATAFATAPVRDDDAVFA
jgi:hypothetical protein